MAKFLKKTYIKAGNVPSYNGTPSRPDNRGTFVGWATEPNSKTYVSTVPAATADATYYAIFTIDAYYYFLLPEKSYTSTSAKDYMHAGRGTVIIPDNLPKRLYYNKYDLSSLMISGYDDAQVRKGLESYYTGEDGRKKYNANWTYTISPATLLPSGSALGYDYKEFQGAGNSVHLDNFVTLTTPDTVTFAYNVADPTGAPIYNSARHDYGNTSIAIQSTVKENGSFTTDTYSYESSKIVSGITYSFDGWYTDTSYTTKADDSVTCLTSKTFYGRYVSSGYSLTYDANGGVFADSSTDETKTISNIQENTIVSIISNPTREGYTFKGWTGYNDKTYVAGQSISMPGKNVTLTAQWEPLKETVTYSWSGVTGTQPTALPASASVNYGSKYDVDTTYTKTSTFTNEYGEWTFSGWDHSGELTITATTEIKGTWSLTTPATTITITANSSSKTYDGTSLVNNGYTFTGTLVPDDTLIVNVVSEKVLIDAGSCKNIVNSYSVSHDNGDGTTSDVTAYYAFSMTEGTLTINKRNVVLTSGSASKQYDGSAITNGTVTVSGDGWAYGEGADYAVTGFQTQEGSSPNKFTYTLYPQVLTRSIVEKRYTNAENYNISVVYGTLTITSAGGGDNGGNNDTTTTEVTTVSASIPPVSNATVPTVGEPITVAEATPPVAASTVAGPVNGRAAATGDDSNMNAYGGIATAGMLGLFAWVVAFLKRKKKEEEA